MATMLSGDTEERGILIGKGMAWVAPRGFLYHGRAGVCSTMQKPPSSFVRRNSHETAEFYTGLLTLHKHSHSITNPRSPDHSLNALRCPILCLSSSGGLCKLLKLCWEESSACAPPQVGRYMNFVSHTSYALLVCYRGWGRLKR